MDCVQDTEEGMVNETGLAVQGTQMGNRHRNVSVLRSGLGGGSKGALWAQREATDPTSGSQGGFRRR